MDIPKFKKCERPFQTEEAFLQNEIKKRTVKQSEIKPNPYINNRKTTNKNRGYTRLTVGIFIVIIVVLLMIMSRLLGNL